MPAPNSVKIPRQSIFRNPWKRRRLAAGRFPAAGPVGHRLVTQMRSIGNGSPVGHWLAAWMLNGMRPSYLVSWRPDHHAQCTTNIRPTDVWSLNGTISTQKRCSVVLASVIQENERSPNKIVTQMTSHADLSNAEQSVTHTQLTATTVANYDKPARSK